MMKVDDFDDDEHLPPELQNQSSSLGSGPFQSVYVCVSD
jgi:hypothetical protein